MLIMVNISLVLQTINEQWLDLISRSNQSVIINMSMFAADVKAVISGDTRFIRLFCTGIMLLKCLLA